jgi:hypothetical protein
MHITKFGGISKSMNRAFSSVRHDPYFDEQVKNLIVMVRDAVKPLESLNTNFKVTDNDSDQLTITCERGKHSIKVSNDRTKVIFQSFISGFHQYYFDEEDQLWLSIKDKHDLRGLITRDVMKHSIGCPNFP